jgi:hypothetical protein
MSYIIGSYKIDYEENKERKELYWRVRHVIIERSDPPWYDYESEQRVRKAQQQDLIASRKYCKKCIMCGEKLRFWDRISRSIKHRQCRDFKNENPFYDYHYYVEEGFWECENCNQYTRNGKFKIYQKCFHIVIYSICF